MKKILQYSVITLILLIQTFLAKASDFNIDEAIKLQYSAPKSAIKLLLSDNENFKLKSNDEFLTHQLLLFRLFQKTGKNSLAHDTFQIIEKR